MWKFLTIALIVGCMDASIAAPTAYNQTNLVSNASGAAATTDSNLINPWGEASSPTSPAWIADQGSSVSTLYNGAGGAIALVVGIPSSPPPSGPTGIVFNGSSSNFGGDHFIFATLSGQIYGWSSGATASLAASTTGAVFTGLATGTDASGTYLYAANSAGGINVFNSSFAPAMLSGGFTDPNLPANLQPFNIQNIGGLLYVTYAPSTGTGTGAVDIFNTNGNFESRLITGGTLNDPWGLAIAPAGFGTYSHDLLVGNKGNGEINAFNPTTGAFLGTLDGSNGKPIVNADLWALWFGTGSSGFDPDTLYFTAGVNNQQGGLLGSLNVAPVPMPATGGLLTLGLVVLSFARFRRRDRDLQAR